jgi:acetoin utilization protein AcuB
METKSSAPTAHSSVEHFMTPNPHCIGGDQSLAAAHSRMRDLKVRHLPVLAGGRLVGILSERDLLFAEGFPRIDAANARVDEAMTQAVYVVPPERPVGEVAATMAERRYGCAVVAREGHVVGIFTTTDALRVIMGIVDAWR